MDLTGVLRGAAARLQFAPESRWEECVALSRGEPADAVLKWFDGFHDESIGAELFYEAGAEGRSFSAFIGFRCNFAKRRAFVEEAARGFAGGKFARAEDFIAAAENEFRAPLFAGRPDFMELGLVNMWKSFGALSFAPLPESPYAALSAAVSASPSWRGALPAPPACEFAFSSPLPHWFGVCLSRPFCEVYALDMKKAEAFMKKLRPVSL